MTKDIRIGIIGGSGVQEIFEGDIVKENIHTPYGPPSGQMEIGTVNNIKIAFLPRHGKGHIIPPHKVNGRANIWAFKEIGVKHIIGISAVGSLKEDYKPGQIAIPDQYIDFTKKRDYTFYDIGKVVHISMADPFCPYLRKTIIDELQTSDTPFHKNGTYICIEGPRFSTRSESKMFRSFADIIGMTLVPEAQLAREKEICYATITMVTDYNVWAEKPVSTKEVVETMKKNVDNVKKLLTDVIPKIKENPNCECNTALSAASM